MANYKVTLNSTSVLSDNTAGPSWSTDFTLPGIATSAELAGYMPLSGGTINGAVTLQSAAEAKPWAGSWAFTAAFKNNPAQASFYAQLDDDMNARAVLGVQDANGQSTAIGLKSTTGSLLDPTGHCYTVAGGVDRMMTQSLVTRAQDGDTITFPTAFASASGVTVVCSAQPFQANDPLVAAIKEGTTAGAASFTVGIWHKDGSALKQPVNVHVIAMGKAA
ncbi:hypothetical protein E3E12_08150 [Formicincola oecophyllae]|uniref:Uncharacterized protein n=1 Tax=Formicincola oecophyllae TaxID=2558361 RepID=A0A4Y6UCJ7_9PROT|nr:hypothetical protein [Formicincola oecophyllae]QDH14167.1 hypothetical protein E3E12_08150 [Formicincola oecophyllae]